MTNRGTCESVFTYMLSVTEALCSPCGVLTNCGTPDTDKQTPGLLIKEMRRYNRVASCENLITLVSVVKLDLCHHTGLLLILTYGFIYTVSVSPTT